MIEKISTVTLYFKDGSIIKDAIISCGILMLNAKTEEDINNILENSNKVTFTSKKIQGNFLPENLIKYYIKNPKNEMDEINKFIKNTNYHNYTDNLSNFIKYNQKELLELLKKLN